MSNLVKNTNHYFYNVDSTNTNLKSKSIHLIVTSPPYPMIDIWDYLYLDENTNIDKLFDKTHLILDKVWKEMYRVLIDGGIICINIGDATKNIENNFQLFSNKTRIINKMLQLGFQLLPGIIWSKPSNSPNKFMGSGMLPVNAYVSLGHEHILIFRKGLKREFNKLESEIRRESAFFYKERNTWFSDVWNINGISQTIKISSRKKSAAFPLEISDRLINMFSIKGDNVLDPFGGTGTTSISAIKCQRNSYYFDIDDDLYEGSLSQIPNLKKKINNQILNRINNNLVFEGNYKYFNKYLNTKVKTKTETNIKFSKIEKIIAQENKIIVNYEEIKCN